MDGSALIPYAGIGGAPVVIALVELVKRSWPDLAPRWYPLIAVGCGIALSEVVALLVGTDLGVAALMGLLSGLTASGLYSGTKASVIEPAREAREERAYQADLQARIDRLTPRG